MAENKSRAEEMTVAQVIEEIREKMAEACYVGGRAPEEVRLMAVTKTVEPSRVNEAIAAGVTLLGENKAQELLAKYDAYEKEQTEIHFIGHLQSNKVRQIIDKVTMIESLDSLSLAEEIERQCEIRDLHRDCLVEINIGGELTKTGIGPEVVENFLEQIASFRRIHVRGIMAIPPICASQLEKERNFSHLRQVFIDIGSKKIDNTNMEILSMGMSDDYLLAIKHGSTQVRLGTVLFGRRTYIGGK